MNDVFAERVRNKSTAGSRIFSHGFIPHSTKTSPSLCLHRTNLFSWGYDGGSHWSFSLGGIIPLPLVDSTGGVIAADGYSLVGYYSDGTPRGNPVLLYPTQGEIFDLTIATEVGVVVLLYKCGFLAAYLTSKPLPPLTIPSG